MNESGAPCVDSVSPGGSNLNVLANGASLGNASCAGFGTSARSTAGRAEPTRRTRTPAWRGRVFQFRIAPVGTVAGNTQPLLEFININKAVSV
jgi:hypothetical protein